MTIANPMVLPANGKGRDIALGKALAFTPVPEADGNRDPVTKNGVATGNSEIEISKIKNAEALLDFLALAMPEYSGRGSVTPYIVSRMRDLHERGRLQFRVLQVQDAAGKPARDGTGSYDRAGAYFRVERRSGIGIIAIDSSVLEHLGSAWTSAHREHALNTLIHEGDHASRWLDEIENLVETHVYERVGRERLERSPDAARWLDEWAEANAPGLKDPQSFLATSGSRDPVHRAFWREFIPAVVTPWLQERIAIKRPGQDLVDYAQNRAKVLRRSFERLGPEKQKEFAARAYDSSSDRANIFSAPGIIMLEKKAQRQDRRVFDPKKRKDVIRVLNHAKRTVRYNRSAGLYYGVNPNPITYTYPHSESILRIFDRYDPAALRTKINRLQKGRVFNLSQLIKGRYPARHYPYDELFMANLQRMIELDLRLQERGIVKRISAETPAAGLRRLLGTNHSRFSKDGIALMEEFFPEARQMVERKMSPNARNAAYREHFTDIPSFYPPADGVFVEHAEAEGRRAMVRRGASYQEVIVEKQIDQSLYRVLDVDTGERYTVPIKEFARTERSRRFPRDDHHPDELVYMSLCEAPEGVVIPAPFSRPLKNQIFAREPLHIRVALMAAHLDARMREWAVANPEAAEIFLGEWEVLDSEHPELENSFNHWREALAGPIAEGRRHAVDRQAKPRYFEQLAERLRRNPGPFAYTPAITALSHGLRSQGLKPGQVAFTKNFEGSYEPVQIEEIYPDGSTRVFQLHTGRRVVMARPENFSASVQSNLTKLAETPFSILSRINYLSVENFEVPPPLKLDGGFKAPRVDSAPIAEVVRLFKLSKERQMIGWATQNPEAAREFLWNLHESGDPELSLAEAHWSQVLLPVLGLK